MLISGFLEVFTPDSGHAGDRASAYQNILDISGRDHITFSLKAPHDGLILLSQEPADSITNNKYAEIVIGGYGNRKSCIRIASWSADETEYNMANQLDATVFTDIWISWNSGAIRVGWGHVINEQLMMQWSFTSSFKSADIKYMAMLTGWGATGTWRIYP